MDINLSIFISGMHSLPRKDDKLGMKNGTILKNNRGVIFYNYKQDSNQYMVKQPSKPYTDMIFS